MKVFYIPSKFYHPLTTFCLKTTTALRALNLLASKSPSLYKLSHQICIINTNFWKEHESYSITF
jgi:hypothetical protein